MEISREVCYSCVKRGRNVRDLSVAGHAKPLQVQGERMEGALPPCLDRTCSNELKLQQGIGIEGENNLLEGKD